MTTSSILVDETATVDQDTPEKKLPPANLMLFVLTAVYAVNLLDRQIVNVLAEPIKQDLGISDTEIGMLSGLVFAAFYTVLGLPMAMIAERTSRVRIIAISCAVWSFFTLLCGLGSNFTQLLMARIGVAVGEAGGAPPSYSLISDFYPAHRRATALSILTLAVPIGGAAGALLAGTIGASHGWRYAFMAAAIPGPILALIMILVMPEPRRGRLDAIDRTVPPAEVGSMRQFLPLFIRTPLMLRPTIAGSLAAFCFYGSSAWIAPFLMRVKGMTLAEVGIFYSIAIGVAIAVGQLAGGILSDLFRRRSEAMTALLPAFGLLAAIPLLVCAVFSDGWQWSLFFFLLLYACCMLYSGPTGALIQNAAPPHQRVLASAAYIFAVNSVGLGLGPVFIGGMSDLSASGNSAAGLKIAVLMLAPVFGLAAIAYFWTARAIGAAQRARDA